jgi:hypothetical protein
MVTIEFEGVCGLRIDNELNNIHMVVQATVCTERGAAARPIDRKSAPAEQLLAQYTQPRPHLLTPFHALMRI